MPHSSRLNYAADNKALIISVMPICRTFDVIHISSECTFAQGIYFHQRRRACAVLFYLFSIWSAKLDFHRRKIISITTNRKFINKLTILWHKLSK